MTSDTFRIRWSQSTKMFTAFHTTMFIRCSSWWSPCVRYRTKEYSRLVCCCSKEVWNNYQALNIEFLLAFWLQVSQKSHLVNWLTLHENVLTIQIICCKFYFMWQPRPQRKGKTRMKIPDMWWCELKVRTSAYISPWRICTSTPRM